MTASLIYLPITFNIQNDLVVSFDVNCSGSQLTAGDGFCVMFIQSLSAVGGGPGPALGYCNAQNISSWTGSSSTYSGIASGMLGVGFDITGNFALSTYCVNGGRNNVPNTISVRGSYLSAYPLLYTTENLAGSAYASSPLLLYHSSTAQDIRYRVRLTDFGTRLVVDSKPIFPNTSFNNYLNLLLPFSVPSGVICALSFSSGIVSANLTISNFTVNGILY